MMMREARGSRGRLVFFTLCLAVGVAAVVAVAGLSAGLDAGIRAQARQILTADLVVSGRRPIPKELDGILAALPRSRRADVKDLVSVVAALRPDGSPGRSLVVELRAVEGEFPFYGELRLDPDRPLAETLDDRSVMVAPELLTRLQLAVGDTLRVGSADFRIAGTVLAEPGRLASSFAIGPRLFLSFAGLERSGLQGFGSRLSYRALVKLDDAGRSVDEAASRIKAAFASAASGFEVQTYTEAQPALRDGLRRGARFLGLGALLSLLIGGIGVAQTVSAWLEGRMDSIAVLKCLGMRPREILALYMGQTIALGLAGSLVGAAAGVLIQVALPRLLGGLVLAYAGTPWQPMAIARGVILGVAVAFVFSLPPLVGVLRVPPVRVLRREAEPVRGSPWARIASAGGVLAGIFLTAWFQSGSAIHGALFTAGLLGAFAILTLAALGVIRAVARLPRGFAGVTARHGLASLARPGAGTIGAIVSLGLGVLVVVSMYLVQDQFRARLRAELPTDAPTAFLVDVQNSQWPEVQRILAAGGASRIDSVPVVVARLSAIDGRKAEDLSSERPDDSGRKWALTREQRLTYLPSLPSNNTIVEGALWSDPAVAEVSLEADFARDLGARIGSILTFDIQGVPIDLRVTSLRRVNWESFGINFFIVVEPGVL
jgi:putative ABC transport system permease protein